MTLSGKTLLAAMAAAFVSTSAVAQMDHSAHGGGPMADYMATMDTMMGAMDGIASSGDADADFLLMMIPHHQSAIDMARVQLEQGDDAETRALAEQIIAAQEQEIAAMKGMLARLGVDMPE